MSEQVEQVEVKRCGQDQMLFASTLMSYLTNESMKRLKLDFEAKEILMEDFVELMEEHLPESYFDFSFIMNLVNLFEEIDVNGDGGMEWDEFTSFIIESSQAIDKDLSGHNMYHHVANIQLTDNISYMSYCQKLRVAFCSEEHTNNTGEHVHTLAGHTSLVTQCVHIAEYMLFATSSMDMTIALWEQDSGQCVYFTTTTTLNEDPMPQTYLMWDSQHKLLFTGAMDGRIIGWQLKITGKIEITRKYVLFEKRKYSLQINEQTKHLLGMNRDGGEKSTSKLQSTINISQQDDDYYKLEDDIHDYDNSRIKPLENEGDDEYLQTVQTLKDQISSGFIYKQDDKYKLKYQPKRRKIIIKRGLIGWPSYSGDSVGMQESIPIKEEMLKAYHRQPLIGGGNRNNMDEDKDGENGQQGKDDLYVQNDVIVMMQQMLSEQQNKQHQDENVQPTLLEKVVMGHEGAITGLVPLPGTIHTIASSSNDGLILLWDVTKEKVRNVLRKHTRAVTCLIWHPQAQLLISGGADNMIHVWNPFVSRNVFSHTFRGHRAIVCAINTIPNTNEFVSMSRDGGVRVWDVKSTLLIQTFSVDIEGIIGGTPDGDSLSITATKGSNISGVGLKQNMSKQQNLAVLKEIQKAQTVINESGPAIKECTALSICGDLSNRLIVAGPRRLAFFDFFCLGKVNQDTVDDVVVGDDQDNGEADEEDIDNFVAVEKKRIDRQKKNLLENMAKGLRIEKRKKAGAIQNDLDTVGQQSSTKNVVGSEIGSIGKKKNFRSEEKKAQLSVTRTAMARGGHYIGIASDNNPFANKRSDGDGEGNVGQILGNAVSSQLAGDGLEQVRSKSGKALQTLLGRSKVQQLEVSLSTHFGYSSTGKKSKVSARPIRSAVYNELYGTIATAVENSTRLFDAHTGYQNGQYEMENLVTALSIDGRQRKLYVGTVEGTVKVYKFNNGALMTELERHVGQPPNAEIVEEEEKTNVDKEVEEEEKIEDEEENKEKEIEKDKEKEQGKNKDQVKIKDKEKEEKVDKDKEKDKDKSQQQQQQSIQPTPKPKSKIKAKAKVNSNLKKKKKQEGDEDDDDEDEQDEDEGEGKKKNSVPITSIQYIDYLGMCFSTSWERRAILASDTEDTVRFISPLSGDLCCGAICESEDMGHVGTGASDKTIRLFDAKSCQMTAQFIADHDVSALSFIGSFPLVISGDSDGVLQMWSYKPCSSRTMVARWINVEQYKLRERNREKEREVAEQEEKERAQLILQQQQQGMNQNLRQRMQMMKQKTFVGGTLGSPQQASTATIVSPNSSQQPPYVNKQQLSNSASGATISTVQQLQVKINQTGSVQEVQGERMTVGITKLCFISNFKMVKTIKREQDGKKNKKKKKKADLEKEQQEKKDEQIQLSITEKQIQDDEKLDFSVDFEDESEQNTTTSEQEEGKMPLLQDAMDQISEDEEDQEQKKKERALLKAQGMSYKRSSQYSQRQSKVNILLNKNNKLTQSNSSITQDDDEEDEESESESSGEIDGEYATLIKQKGSGENDQSKQQKRKKKEEQEKDQQNQNDGEEKDETNQTQQSSDESTFVIKQYKLSSQGSQLLQKFKQQHQQQEQKPNVVIREKIKVPKVRKYGQLVVVGDEQGFVTIYNVAWIIAELGIKRIEEYIKEKEKEAEEQGGQFKKEEGTNFSVHYHPLKKTRLGRRERDNLLLVGRFRAHKDSITSLQYIPLNEALLTSSLDGHICIWHLGKFVRSLQQAKRAGGRNMKFTGRLIQQQWHADVIEENGYYNIWWNGCIRPIRRLPQCLGRIHSIKGVVERYKPIDAWGWGSLGLWWDGQSDKLEIPQSHEIYYEDQDSEITQAIQNMQNNENKENFNSIKKGKDNQNDQLLSQTAPSSSSANTVLILNYQNANNELLSEPIKYVSVSEIKSEQQLIEQKQIDRKLALEKAGLDFQDKENDEDNYKLDSKRSKSSIGAYEKNSFASGNMSSIFSGSMLPLNAQNIMSGTFRSLALQQQTQPSGLKSQQSSQRNNKKVTNKLSSQPPQGTQQQQQSKVNGKIPRMLSQTRKPQQQSGQMLGGIGLIQNEQQQQHQQQGNQLSLLSVVNAANLINQMRDKARSQSTGPVIQSQVQNQQQSQQQSANQKTGLQSVVGTIMKKGQTSEEENKQQQNKNVIQILARKKSLFQQQKSFAKPQNTQSKNELEQNEEDTNTDGQPLFDPPDKDVIPESNKLWLFQPITEPYKKVIQEKVNEILDHIGKMLFDKRKEKEETAGGDFGNGLIVQAKHHEEKEKDNKWKKPKSKQKRKKEKVGEDKDEKEEEKDKSKDSEQEINEKEKNKKDNISTFFITSTGQSDDQNQSSLSSARHHQSNISSSSALQSDNDDKDDKQIIKQQKSKPEINNTSNINNVSVNNISIQGIKSVSDLHKLIKNKSRLGTNALIQIAGKAPLGSLRIPLQTHQGRLKSPTWRQMRVDKQNEILMQREQQTELDKEKQRQQQLLIDRGIQAATQGQQGRDYRSISSTGQSVSSSINTNDWRGAVQSIGTTSIQTTVDQSQNRSQISSQKIPQTAISLNTRDTQDRNVDLEFEDSLFSEGISTIKQKKQEIQKEMELIAEKQYPNRSASCDPYQEKKKRMDQLMKSSIYVSNYEELKKQRQDKKKIMEQVYGYGSPEMLLYQQIGDPTQRSQSRSPSPSPEGNISPISWKSQDVFSSHFGNQSLSTRYPQLQSEQQRRSNPIKSQDSSHTGTTSNQQSIISYNSTTFNKLNLPLPARSTTGSVDKRVSPTRGSIGVNKVDYVRRSFNFQQKAPKQIQPMRQSYNTTGRTTSPLIDYDTIDVDEEILRLKRILLPQLNNEPRRTQSPLQRPNS